MTGYSGTPLLQKLGIKSGQRVALLQAPPNFAQTLGELPDLASLSDQLRGRLLFDVILFFTTSRRQLKKRFAGLKKKLQPTGGLWIAWPKKASGVETDMSEDEVRTIALPGGLVDNKVCAIDETWSGLRLVYRLKDRPPKLKSG